MYLKTEYIYEKNKVLKCGYSLPNINMNIDVTPVLVINKKRDNTTQQRNNYY